MIRHRCGLVAILVSLVVSMGLAGCQVQPGSSEAPVQTVAVTRGNLNATVNAAGSIAAHTSDTLSFQTSGQVKQILVQVGDQVKAGQKLAQLDTTDLELALADAQLGLDTARIKLEQARAGPDPADVASARASLASAESAYKTALAKYKLRDDQRAVARAQLDRAAAALERAQFAYEWVMHDWLRTPRSEEPRKEALDNAQEAYDDALHAYNSALTDINDTALRSAEAQVASARSQLDDLEKTPTPESLAIAEAQVKQAELDLRQAQLNLDKATLTAPFDGVVTDVAVQVGQRVEASTAAIGLADLARLEISVALPEVDAPRVQVGQHVTITMDALNGKQLPGQVVEVALVSQTTQNVVSYPAVVQLTGHDPDVRPGMNASLSIVVARRQNVLIAPNRAIRTVDRQRSVTLYYDGQLIALPVSVGMAGDTHSEVSAEWLREGDLLVLNPASVSENRTFGFGIGMMFGRR